MRENKNSDVFPSVQIYTAGGCEPNPGPGGGAGLMHPADQQIAALVYELYGLTPEEIALVEGNK